MGFTKLDEEILKSSIMSEPSDIFKIWIALMAACKEDGVARVAPSYLVKICNLSLETVTSALEFLQQPDPHSRSIEEEGRRIKKVDGGFFLVNYKKYKERLYSNSKAAKRKREWRDRQKGHGRDVSRKPRDISASVYEYINKILKYLNEQTGKKFRVENKETQSLIQARLDEGRTFEDFKKVIDVKVAKWKGKTWINKQTGDVCYGNDYLRPWTLFRPRNFESYLNEEMPIQDQGRDYAKIEADQRARQEARDKELGIK